MILEYLGKLSILQTTTADVSLNPSSQTVPQVPLWKTASLPSYGFVPLIKRTTGTNPIILLNKTFDIKYILKLFLKNH